MRVSWRSVGTGVLLAVAFGIDQLLWSGDTRSTLVDGLPAAPFALLSAVVFAQLAWSRRRPGVTFAVCWVQAVAMGLLLLNYQPFVAVLIALHQVARYLRIERAVWFLLAALVPFTLNAFRVAAGRPPEDLALSLALYGVLAAATWATGRLGWRGQRVREASAAEAALAVQRERLRLARELHDIVSHSVSAMMMQAAGIRAVVPDADPLVRSTLRTIETTGRQAMVELHGLLALLHASADAVGEPTGEASLATLPDLLTTVRSCQIAVELTVSGAPRPLDPVVDHVAYRVIQESLTNVIKHGGRGARATVGLGWGDELRIAVVSRPGEATSELAHLGSGFGQRGLEARVVAVGGALTAGQGAADSYAVEAVLPLAGVGAPEITGRSDGRVSGRGAGHQRRRRSQALSRSRSPT